MRPRPPRVAAAFLRSARAFTGAEKALALCFGLAMLALVGRLVGDGGSGAADDARRRLVANPLVGGSMGVGLLPVHAAALQVPGRPRAPAALTAPRVALPSLADYERKVGFLTFRAQKPPAGTGLLADIEAHLPGQYGTIYRDANPITWGHETTHGINSHLRRLPELNQSGHKINGFYVGHDRALTLEEPPITKSSVGGYIPEVLRGFRFQQYVTGQTDFEHEPLYLLDEWTAYANGAEVGLELVKSGQWNQPNQDGVAGPVEFTGYAFGLGMAVEAQHPGYLAAHPQLRDFIGWQAMRSLDLYREGAKTTQFGGFSEQGRLYQALRESPAAQPVRDFIRQQYGAAYLQRLLYGAEGGAPPAEGPPAGEPPRDEPRPPPPTRDPSGDGWVPSRGDAGLRARFEIVPDNAPADRRPNQLTEAEFAQVNRLYEDIRDGKTDLRFAASDVAADPGFRDGVMKDLGTLMQTKAGRELVAALAHNPRGNGVTIKMHRDAQGRPDTSNAYADAADPNQRGRWGDGRGVPAVMAYVPGRGVVVPGGSSSWLPLRVDTVLYHEMVHAYHMTRGTMDDSLVQSGLGISGSDVAAGIRNSEYQAVGLGKYADAPLSENRYRAERRRIGEHTGSVAGDSTMNRRDEYVLKTGPSAPPPPADDGWTSSPPPRQPPPQQPPPRQPPPQQPPRMPPPQQPPIDTQWVPVGPQVPIGPWIPVQPQVPIGPWIPVGPQVPIGTQWVPIGTQWVPVGPQWVPVGPQVPIGTQWVPVGPQVPIGTQWVPVQPRRW